MRIWPLPTRKERTEPVHYGEGSQGKRNLVKAVMEAGYSKRTGEKAVNAVIVSWKSALASGDRKIEMPLGHLRVRKTPDRLRKRRYVAARIGKRALKRSRTWTVYNDEKRILWRVKPEQWAALIDGLNPGLPPEPVETRKAEAKEGKPAAGAQPKLPPGPLHPPLIAVVPRGRPVPSRTDPFRRR